MLLYNNMHYNYQWIILAFIQKKQWIFLTTKGLSIYFNMNSWLCLVAKAAEIIYTFYQLWLNKCFESHESRQFC